MAWLVLLLAAVCEVGWAVGLKYTEGFTRPLPTALTVLTMLASFVLLAQAVRTLPLGTGYAVWTGIGVVGTTVLGIWLFDEPLSAVRIGCIGLIVAGIVGLRLTSGA